MNQSDYSSFDALGLAAGIKNGDFTIGEITTAAINAIEALNPILNAVVIKNYENSPSSISASSVPLPGVPFLIKDANVFTHDMPTTFSCRFFENVDPRPDSEIVRRWRESGLNVLGKSNTPEFAEDYVCEPTFRGATLNPWNTSLTTGGSSGGAASAVASGMVPVAHATDLGGSIRIPAACCGVFGLKPTTGLNPVDFAQPELASGFNSDHVVSRSVRDSAALLDVTAHPIAGYRYQVDRSVDSYLDCLDDPLPVLRIGVCTKTPVGNQSPVCQAAGVNKISSLLADQGHEIVEYEYPQDLDFGAWIDTLWMFDVVAELDSRISELGRQPEPNELEALTRYILKTVSSSTAMDHYRARLLAHRNSIKLMATMQDIDCVLTPALGCDPVPVGTFDSRTDAFNYDEWIELGNQFAPFSYVCNMTGQPAASVPVINEGDQFPCSVQLAGHLGQDHRILQLSALVERLHPWQAYRPPVWAGNR